MGEFQKKQNAIRRCLAALPAPEQEQVGLLLNQLEQMDLLCPKEAFSLEQWQEVQSAALAGHDPLLLAFFLWKGQAPEG